MSFYHKIKERIFDCIPKYCIHTFIILYFSYPESYVRIKFFILLYLLRLYIHIHHLIFVVPWLIRQGPIQIFLRRILTLLSGSNANNLQVVSWLVCQDPMKIFLESFLDSSLRVQHKYCFAYWFNIVSGKKYLYKSDINVEYIKCWKMCMTIVVIWVPYIYFYNKLNIGNKIYNWIRTGTLTYVHIGHAREVFYDDLFFFSWTAPLVTRISYKYIYIW